MVLPSLVQGGVVKVWQFNRLKSNACLQISVCNIWPLNTSLPNTTDFKCNSKNSGNIHWAFRVDYRFYYPAIRSRDSQTTRRPPSVLNENLRHLGTLIILVCDDLQTPATLFLTGYTATTARPLPQPKRLKVFKKGLEVVLGLRRIAKCPYSPSIQSFCVPNQPKYHLRLLSCEKFVIPTIGKSRHTYTKTSPQWRI